MGEQFAAFGATYADPRIPWPKRGSAERVLSSRAGWSVQTIPTVVKGKPATIEAAVHSVLAVHRMVDGEGFAISLASNGFRISYGGAVFARCGDAMVAAETMLAGSAGWTRVPDVGFTDKQREALRVIIDAATQRGEILLDRVYPAA